MDGGIFMGKFNIFFKPAVIFLFLSPHNHARASEKVVRSLSLQKAMEISAEVQQLADQVAPLIHMFSEKIHETGLKLDEINNDPEAVNLETVKAKAEHFYDQLLKNSKYYKEGMAIFRSAIANGTFEPGDYTQSSMDLDDGSIHIFYQNENDCLLAIIHEIGHCLECLLTPKKDKHNKVKECIEDVSLFFECAALKLFRGSILSIVIFLRLIVFYSQIIFFIEITHRFNRFGYNRLPPSVLRNTIGKTFLLLGEFFPQGLAKDGIDLFAKSHNQELKNLETYDEIVSRDYIWTTSLVRTKITKAPALTSKKVRRANTYTDPVKTVDDMENFLSTIYFEKNFSAKSSVLFQDVDPSLEQSQEYVLFEKKMREEGKRISRCTSVSDGDKKYKLGLIILSLQFDRNKRMPLLGDAYWCGIAYAVHLLNRLDANTPIDEIFEDLKKPHPKLNFKAIGESLNFLLDSQGVDPMK
jgi:hypothetical protein